MTPLVLSLILASYNNTIALLPLARSIRMLLNLVMVVALLVTARVVGLSGEELGIRLSEASSGLLWGGTIAAIIVLATFLALRVGALRRRFADRRYAALSCSELALELLVRLPLATVLLEEIAFRGVLLAAWNETFPSVTSIAASSIAFGLWHVGPALDRLRRNPPHRDRRQVLGVILGTVLATALVGVGFCVLRIISRSIVAPALVHYSANAAGMLAARVVSLR